MIIAVSSFQEGPFSKRFSDTLKRKAPFTWLSSVLDGRLKAVVSTEFFPRVIDGGKVFE